MPTACLADITVLAAELEANAALSLYRFGASRAYYNIVGERISSLNESGQPGFETIGAFLEKRLAPAMRTCQSIEERQANLSRKLSRATALLRSWIDVELEQQNSALLSSMNRRVKLQLRMQQTVEGLSVAAISYYIVGLFGYHATRSQAGAPRAPSQPVRCRWQSALRSRSWCCSTWQLTPADRRFRRAISAMSKTP